MLSDIQSKSLVKDNTAFVDSSKSRLKSINDKFQALLSTFRNNKDQMQQYAVTIEDLKNDLFDLYNNVVTVQQELINKR